MTLFIFKRRACLVHFKELILRFFFIFLSFRFFPLHWISFTFWRVFLDWLKFFFYLHFVSWREIMKVVLLGRCDLSWRPSLVLNFLRLELKALMMGLLLSLSHCSSLSSRTDILLLHCRRRKNFIRGSSRTQFIFGRRTLTVKRWNMNLRWLRRFLDWECLWRRCIKIIKRLFSFILMRVALRSRIVETFESRPTLLLQCFSSLLFFEVIQSIFYACAFELKHILFLCLNNFWNCCLFLFFN